MKFFNRESAGLGILLAGLITSGVSGKIFLDKFNNLTERSLVRNRVELYADINAEDLEKCRKDDNSLVCSGYGIFIGFFMTGIGYVKMLDENSTLKCGVGILNIQKTNKPHTLVCGKTKSFFDLTVRAEPKKRFTLEQKSFGRSFSVYKKELTKNLKG